MAQAGQDKTIAASEISGAEALEALLQQSSAAQTARPSRRHVRKRWVIELRIRVVESGTTGAVDRELCVTTQDLSRGGFSFVCRQFLHIGTHVQAEVRSLPGSPVLTAEVANCEYDGNGQHRVGVKLVQVNS